MKKVIVIIILVIASVVGLILLGNEKVQLVDVRTTAEYSTSHANGAINIPLASLQTGDFSKIDKKATIKVYCRSGKRAAEAKTLLEKAGYTKVINIGGLENWQNKGGSVCKSTKPTC